MSGVLGVGARLSGAHDARRSPPAAARSASSRSSSARAASRSGCSTEAQYSLILAGAIVSITVNPLMMRLVEPAERALRAPAARSGGCSIAAAPDAPPTAGGARGSRRDRRLRPRRPAHRRGAGAARNSAPRHRGRSDARGQAARARRAGAVRRRRQLGDSRARGARRARALVITLPDDAAALAVVATARHAGAGPAHHRARVDLGRRAAAAAHGAGEVVRPELEGGVEIVRRTLLDLELPGARGPALHRARAARRARRVRAAQRRTGARARGSPPVRARTSRSAGSMSGPPAPWPAHVSPIRACANPRA